MNSFCPITALSFPEHFINFHKARALRHTSALSRYNSRSLRHQFEHAQFTIHCIKEIKKKTCSSYIVELY